MNTKKSIILAAVVCLTFFSISGIAFSKITKEDFSGLWLFDEGAGKTVGDSSGNGNDGDIIGDLKWVDGKFGKALEFPGESLNLVQIPNSDSLNPTTGITIMAWGWLADTNGNRRFLQKSTPGSDNQYRLLLEWGSFKFDAGPGVNPKEVTTPIFSTEEWHHVAGVYDGKETAIYYDGEKVASQDASGEMTPSDGPIFLGAKWNDP
ncbi:MAG: LamG-like jellyroll fold domain-containing protein, partial [Candidatus Poribacteria bacterium]